ncbi:MAG: 4Fe-4S binding protein [Planctomycetota bacterium]
MISLRRLSQIIFIGLFIYFLLLTVDPHSPVNVFFITNPLLALTTILAGRTLVILLGASLIIILSALLLGRVFCGWVCPLGTILDVFHKFITPKICLEKKIPAGLSRNFPKIKYLLLVLILSAAVLGINLAGWFDPITITFKFLALSFYPALNLIIKNIMIDRWGWSGLSQPLENVGILDRNEVFFQDAAVFIIIFLIILGLIFIQRRFWCRNLCPLGALLGLLSFSKLLRLKIGTDCLTCQKCVKTCKMGAINNEIKILQEECIQCFACVPVCPVDTVSLNFKPIPVLTNQSETGFRPTEISGLPARRSFLLAALIGVASAPLLSARGGSAFGGKNNLSPAALTTTDNNVLAILRPPGALPSEEEFMNRCVRCGQCLKICPTNGLQPLFLQSGLYGMWTPALMPLIGYCTYECNLCTQICPTEAIQPLEIDVKKKWVIGKACINDRLCIRCGACEEHCPVPEKAIKAVWDEYGEKPLRYYVECDLCIGCGLCEHVCPVKPVRAIRVYHTGDKKCFNR